MATLPFLANVIRADYRWSDASGMFGSRLFFQSGAGPYASGDLSYFANQLATLWGTNMAGDVANQYALVQVHVTDLTNNMGLEAAWSGNINGSAGTNDYPSNCSVNIRSLIPQHYRGGHPVLHHPPPNIGEGGSARTFSSSYCAGVQTHWTNYMNAVLGLAHGAITSTFQVIPLGYKPGAASSAVHVQIVEAWLVPTKIGTMRRRLSSAT